MTEAAANEAPRRVVAIGGGTGMPAVLRGLKDLVGNGDREALTAVVAMTDDGGSSGRLRRSRKLPPPGDVRNCLVALSPEEDLLAGLFQHRYEGSGEIGGHTLGNLILAALAEQTGNFLRAVEMSSRVLRTVGRILPVTLDDAVLEAELDDGSRVSGESRIATCGKRVRRVSVRPADAAPAPGVVESIEAADLVVLGPGSLFTSIVPNLVVSGVAKALRETRAVVVLVGNMVSERGEGVGLSLGDHVQVVEQHVGGDVVDAILVHEGAIEHEVLQRYRSEGAHPLAWTGEPSRSVRVVRRNLRGPGPKLRHDPSATARALVETWRELRRGSGWRGLFSIGRETGARE